MEADGGGKKKRGNPKWKKGVSGNPKGRVPGPSSTKKLAEMLADFETETGKCFALRYIQWAFEDKKVACDLADRLYPALKSIEGNIEVVQKILNAVGLEPLVKDDNRTDDKPE